MESGEKFSNFAISDFLQVAEERQSVRMRIPGGS